MITYWVAQLIVKEFIVPVTIEERTGITFLKNYSWRESVDM